MRDLTSSGFVRETAVRQGSPRVGPSIYIYIYRCLEVTSGLCPVARHGEGGLGPEKNIAANAFSHSLRRVSPRFVQFNKGISSSLGFRLVFVLGFGIFKGFVCFRWDASSQSVVQLCDATSASLALSGNIQKQTDLTQ